MTRISSYCTRGECVAVTAVAADVWVHPSALPWWRGVRFTAAEWGVFTAGVRDGEFDFDALDGDTAAVSDV